MTDSHDERGAELRELFHETSQELLQALNDEALTLEKNPGDPEIVRSIRRTVHTLKGDSAACGLRELSDLAHQFEDALGAESASAHAALAEICFVAADVFTALRTAYHDGTPMPATEALRHRIAELTSSAPAAPKKTRKKSASAQAVHGPDVTGNDWTEAEKLAVADARTRGMALYAVTVKIDPHCSMPIAARQLIHNAVNGVGQVLVLRPDAASAAAGKHVDFILASPRAVDEIKAKCQIPTIAGEVGVHALADDDGVKSPRKAKLAKPKTRSGNKLETESEIELQTKSETKREAKPAIEPETNAAAPPAIDGAAEPSPAPASLGFSQAQDSFANASNALAPTSLPLPEGSVSTPAAPASALAPTSPPAAAENILRVEAGRIDAVLNLVGELIIGKSMLQQALTELGARYPKELLRGKFADAIAFQSTVLNNLQRSVMKIRMVPVEQLFRRFPRLVRDVSRQCGRDVDLELQGQETDLDKGILDAIAEPLTHLVRNAVSHGIETAEQRKSAGKPPRGKIRLNAFHQGNQVIVELKDDGRGIDSQKIRAKAIQLGLIKAEEAPRLSEAEALELIFRPGFSTAEEVTEVSGRGVGMDVVQSVLHRLKATIHIETHLGQGTAFRMKLPLTLAIIKALMFWVEHRLYAIPLNSVSQIARSTEAEVHQVDNYEVLQLRDQVLPLLRLGRPADPAADRRAGKLFVLVITVGEKKYGLIVDRLEGEEELVIKALDNRTFVTDLVNGASILGDGKVVLILNLNAVVEHAARLRPATAGSASSGLLLNHSDLAPLAQGAGGQS